MDNLGDNLKDLFNDVVDDNDTDKNDIDSTNDDDNTGDNINDTDTDDNNNPDTDITDDSNNISIDELQNDINTLRTLVQEQTRLIQTLSSQSSGLIKNLSDNGTLAGDVDLTDESNQDILSESRLESLSVLREAMAVSPQYENFEEICSQENFNRVVEGLAQLALQTEGGTLTEHVATISSNLWELPNPYKFVYDIVMQHSDDSDRNPKELIDDKNNLDINSLSNIPGGDTTGNSGWTAAKIDAMEEEELHKVPAKIYEDYMVGKLK